MSAIELAKAAKDDYDLRQAWSKANESFLQTTKCDLPKPPEGVEGTARDWTPQQFLEAIAARKGKHDEKQAKYEAARKVLDRTMVCIQQITSLAAQPASSAAPGAGLCCNAVLYLVSAGQNYGKIFSSLEELFNLASDILERCLQYLQMDKTDVDITLRKIIYQLLLRFVRVCELSIQILQENRLKVALKVIAFNDDAGIQDELEQLRTLADNELQMKTTLIYQTLKSTERNLASGFATTSKGLQKLENAQREQKGDKAKKEQRQRIAKYFGNDLPNYRSIFDNLKKEKVTGMGMWLDGDRNFRAWSQNERPGPQFLYLSGKEGTGKSHLMMSIVQKLKERYFRSHTDELDRVHIAYTFVGQETKQERHSSHETWKHRDRSPLVTVIKVKISYLLFDGIDQLDETWGIGHQAQFLAELLNYTGSVESSTVQHAKGQRRTPNVCKHSSRDMKEFINVRLINMDIFKSKSPDVAALKAKVSEDLPKIANGNFILAGYKLDDIGRKTRVSGVEKLLEQINEGTSLSDTIKDDVRRLNNTLDPKDLRDLNELLLWSIGAYCTFTVSELESALCLRRERSLVPLYDQLKSTYSAFFAIDQKEDLGSNPDADELLAERTSSHGAVLISEINIVKRFLRWVCDDTLYEKFGFEDFFHRKAGLGLDIIAVDYENRHIQLLQRCLEAICLDIHAEDTIRAYARLYFIDHLVAVDLSRSNPSEKAKVGRLLVPLFHDPEIISNIWRVDLFYACDWLDKSSSDYLGGLLAWLKVPAVTEQLDEDDREWAKQVVASSTPRENLLYPVAVFMATEWLNNFCNIFMTFNFLHGYVVRLMRHEAGNRNYRFRMFPGVDKSPLLDSEAIENEANLGSELDKSHVYECFEWAREHTAAGKEEDALQVLASTLRDRQHISEAIKNFEKASELTHDNVYILYGLAMCYASNDDYARAVQVMEDAFAKQSEHDRQKWLENWHYPMREMRRDHGNWCVEVQRYARAVQVYNSILDDDSRDEEVILDIVRARKQEGAFDELLDFQLQLDGQHDEHSRLIWVFRRLSANDDYHDYHPALSEAVSRCGNLHFVSARYDEAMEEARSFLQQQKATQGDVDDALAVHAWLLYWGALFTFNYTMSIDNPAGSSVELQEESAMSLLEEVVQLHQTHPNHDLDWAKNYAILRLSAIYMDRAKRESFGSELAESYLDKTREFSEDGYFGDTSIWGLRLLLSRYYKLEGSVEEARNLARGHMKNALEFLSDEDPTNDWQGYGRIGYVLKTIGDERNALTAFSLLTRFYQKTILGDYANEGKNFAQDRSFAHMEGPLYFSCDGSCCDKKWDYMDDMYHCCDCRKSLFLSSLKIASLSRDSFPPIVITTLFKLINSPTLTHSHKSRFSGYCPLPPHYQQLKTGEHRFATCNASHTFIHVPPYDEEDASTNLRRNKVRVGGDVLPITQWLSQLREEWDLKET
ncbi:MAG: hypothetical protein M1831_001252 [Alyxoria varia]|nr:MAG: hypothetical protein M1831_001252 [Alyxoria varia]